jgi:glycosyltransferase involved in cell wall biosynthesis
MGFLGVNNPIVWLWNSTNKMVYRDARVVITIGKHMARRLRSNCQGCNVDIEVISPWADIHSITPLSYQSNPLSQKFNPKRRSIVLYSGNMGKSHDIESMLEAVRSLSYRQDILFLFIGSGAFWQTALNFKNEHDLTNLDVYPFQAQDCLPYTMTLATLSLVALDEDVEELMVPSKVFYYLAAGSAVIGVCKGENELRDIIEGADCGICISPRSSQQLASEIVALIDDKNRTNRYRKNARAVAVSSYSREVGISKFISIFSKMGWIVLNAPKGNL